MRMSELRPLVGQLIAFRWRDWSAPAPVTLVAIADKGWQSVALIDGAPQRVYVDSIGRYLIQHAAGRRELVSAKQLFPFAAIAEYKADQRAAKAREDADRTQRRTIAAREAAETALATDAGYAHRDVQLHVAHFPPALQVTISGRALRRLLDLPADKTTDGLQLSGYSLTVLGKDADAVVSYYHHISRRLAGTETA